MFYVDFMCFYVNSKLFAPEYLAAGVFFPAKNTLLRISSFLCPRYLAAGVFFCEKDTFENVKLFVPEVSCRRRFFSAPKGVF